MDGAKPPTVFDGHNDVLLALMDAGGPDAAPGFLSGLPGHLDMQKAKAGGFAGGLFAVYVPSHGDFPDMMEAMKADRYDLPLPPPVPLEEAAPFAMRMIATLLEMERLGAVKICRTAAEVEAAMVAGEISAVMHMEGAEAIDEDLAALDVLYAAGLRSLGPVWSRPTIFGHGVPFRFPSDGDTGPGLTDAGRRLVKRCDELGVLIDLSHLNEEGFWDVARISDKPLIATHSNAHGVTPHARNLTDRQLDAIAERDGMVGLNFAVAFLRDDGRMLDVGLEAAIRHLDHLIRRLGEDRVGFGSDFDGAEIPSAIGSAAGLTSLCDAMGYHGFGEDLIAKICHRNWVNALRRVWGE